MRKNETTQVEQSLSQLGLTLRVVRAAHNFMEGTTTLAAETATNSTTLNNKTAATIGARPKLTKMLCATTSPEEKRKIIGDVFVRVANDAMTEMGLKPEDVFLGQGTLRPDLIESASIVASGKICF